MSAHRATTGGLDSVRAVHARSDGSRHAPFTPACGTGTEASRTNDLHPALALGSDPGEPTFKENYDTHTIMLRILARVRHAH